MKYYVMMNPKCYGPFLLRKYSKGLHLYLNNSRLRNYGEELWYESKDHLHHYYLYCPLVIDLESVYIESRSILIKSYTYEIYKDLLNE